MGIAVGIDLGTTNSCVAVVQGDQAKVIADLAGKKIGRGSIAVNFLKHMEAVNVQVPRTETYTAAERGLTFGSISTPASHAVMNMA